MPTFEALGPLGSLAASCTWAIGVSAYAPRAARYSPFAVNFTRCLVAWPLFVTVALVSGDLPQLFEVPVRQIIWLVVSIIASLGLGDAVFFTSTRALGVPAALAIASVYPGWAALAGWALRGEQLSLPRWLGVLLAVSGVIAVIAGGAQASKSAPRPPQAGLSGKTWFGLTLAVVTSVFWAINSYAIARGTENLPVAVANSVRMLAAIVICAALGSTALAHMGTESSQDARPLLLPRAELRSILWIFVLEGFCGSYFFVFGFRYAPLGVAAALSSMSPILIAIVARARGQRLGTLRSAGIVLAGLGVWLLVGVFG